MGIRQNGGHFLSTTFTGSFAHTLQDNWQMHCTRLVDVRGELTKLRHMRSYLHQFRAELNELRRHRLGLGFAEVSVDFCSSPSNSYPLSVQSTNIDVYQCALKAATFVRQSLPPNTPTSVSTYRDSLFKLLRDLGKSNLPGEDADHAENQTDFLEILQELGLCDEVSPTCSMRSTILIPVSLSLPVDLVLRV